MLWLERGFQNINDEKIDMPGVILSMVAIQIKQKRFLSSCYRFEAVITDLKKLLPVCSLELLIKQNVSSFGIVVLVGRVDHVNRFAVIGFYSVKVV